MTEDDINKVLAESLGKLFKPMTINEKGEVIETTYLQQAEDWATGKWILFKDETPNGSLSTVFIGLGAGAPYFETMLFGEGDYVVGRYETYAEAEKGHAAEKMKRT